MHSLLVSLPQSVVYDVYDVLLLNTLRAHALEIPTACTGMTVTRPDQGVEQEGALDSASSKGSDKPVV